MPKVATGITTPGDTLGSQVRTGIPQGRQQGPPGQRLATGPRDPGPPGQRLAPFRPRTQQSSTPYRAYGPPGQPRDVPTYRSYGPPGRPRDVPPVTAPAGGDDLQSRVLSSLGGFFGTGGDGSRFRAIALRNLELGNRTGLRDLGLAETVGLRGIDTADRLAQVSRDASRDASLGATALQREFLSENVGLLRDTRALEDRTGFRDFLSSTAGLAQGTRRRLRRDLLDARALRDRSDALSESQQRRSLAAADADTLEAHRVGAETQTIRGDAARADLSDRLGVGRENLADRLATGRTNIEEQYADDYSGGFSIGSLPVYNYGRD